MKQALNDKSKKETLFILTGNHNSKLGINDHIEIIKRSFENEFIVTLSEVPVSGHHNLIIEEFTKPWFNNALRSALNSSSKTKLHLLLTEIPSWSKNRLTLNSFNDPPNSVFTFLAIALVPILRSLNKPILRRLLKKPWLIIKKIFWPLNALIKSSMKEAYYQAYMNQRGSALNENISLFHSFIDMHSNISNGMLTTCNVHSITLLPPLSKNINPSLRSTDKNKAIYLTGAMTAYREKIFERLRTQCNELSNEHNLVSKGFISDEELIRGASFTINIPQSFTWSYSSPVRIYRSYNVGMVPIVYKKFNDHPLEKCSILWNDFINITDLNAEKMEENLKQQISTYIKYQAKCYNEIILRMRS